MSTRRSQSPEFPALAELSLIGMGLLIGPLLFATAIVAAVGGLVPGLVVGALFLALVLSAAVVLRRSRQANAGGAALSRPGDPSSENELAARDPHGSRLLIMAGQAASGPEDLPAGIRSLIESAESVFVVAPTLPRRLDWLTSSTDNAEGRADERLHQILNQVEQMDTSAEGAVGADDPLLAFEDAFREFRPDHLLIGLRAQSRQGWQEKGLLDQVEARFDIPVTVFRLPR